MDTTKISQTKRNVNGPDFAAAAPSLEEVAAEPATGGTSLAELDPNLYRLDQNFAAHVQARKKAVVVPVARPDRQQWIYIHQDPAWRLAVSVLDDKVNRRTYIVLPKLVPEVTEDLVPKLLVSYVTRTGNPGLWPIRLPGEDSRIDTFNESALAIVNEHAGQWIRVLCEQAERSYSVLECPPIELPAPKWPEGGFRWMFETAFKGRVIKTLDHPLLQTLRGSISSNTGNLMY